MLTNPPVPLRRCPNFTSTYHGVNVQHCVLNVKAVVAAFNQENALVGAFSVTMNLRMELFESLGSVSPLVKCSPAPMAAMAPAPLPACQPYKPFATATVGVGVPALGEQLLRCL